MAHFRDLKRRLSTLLAGERWREECSELDTVPAKHLSGPLFSLLLHPQELVRWRAAEVFGLTMARLAETPAQGGLEAARGVLRQCLWRLNEESGGLGWGAPEALGATLARHPRLAEEFHRMLASYVREETTGEGNYLEHVPLRRGVFWALGRLAQARPELVRREVASLLAGLGEEDAANRGLCAWTLGLACAGTGGPAEVLGALRALVDDPAPFALFVEGRLESPTVGETARQALRSIG
jgi:hypothetical protein